MTWLAGSLLGGNASLSGVRLWVGLPGLQWTLGRNSWGRAQTEGVTRYWEGGGELPSLLAHFQLQLFSGTVRQQTVSPGFVCLWWVAATPVLLQYWDYTINKLWDISDAKCHLRIFSSSCILLLEQGNSSMWFLVLQNNSMGPYVIWSNHLILQI